MKKITQLLLLFLCSLLLTNCSLFSKKDPQPELPPATQEGKHTFGCKVNGEVWLPSGFNGTPNLVARYGIKYFFDSNTFNITTYRNKNQKIYQHIGIYSDSLIGPGVYPLYIPEKHKASFLDFETRCFYREDTYFKGTLTVTKLDTQRNIISGLFELTFAQPDCDTIRVTEGRFDVKY